MLKTTKPLSDSDNIDFLLGKLKRNVRFTPKERDFAIKRIQQNFPRCISEVQSKENSAKDEELQTLPYISDSIISSFHDENEYFWFLENESTDDLIKELQLLAEQDNKNQKKIKLLMDRTFIKRRDFVLRDSPSLYKMKCTYPTLFSLNEIKHELARIFHRELWEQFHRNVRRYSGPIVSKLAEEEVVSPETSSIAYKLLAIMEEDNELKTVWSTPSIASILLLCEQLSNGNFIVYGEMISSKYPYILAPSERDVFYNEQTMELVVENTKFCKSVSFIDAVFCMLSSFFILNICYPPVYYSLMVAMEKLYLGDLGTEVPEIISDLLESLLS